MTTYTVTAMCDGETATATVVIPAPAMNVTADVATLLVDITVQDISDLDRTLTVDWGDGSSTDTITNVGSTGTGQHTYADDSGNPYTITVTGNNTSAVATTTATVVEPAPTQLDTPANLAASAITETGYTVTFDAVTNASSYTATASPGTLTGVVTDTTAVFTGATPGTEYTVSVIAVGDGTSYSDSDAGTLSVTTTDYTSPTVAADVSQDPVATANVTTIDDADTTVSISWGDGTADTTGVAVTDNAATSDHTYGTNDTFTITVTGDVSGKTGTTTAVIAGN